MTALHLTALTAAVFGNAVGGPLTGLLAAGGIYALVALLTGRI